MLEARYCDDVNDPKLAELGVHQSGDETWIVMAVRTETPFAALQDPAAVAQRVVELVNAARAEARRCGRDRFDAAPPLAVSTTLMAAASLHSLDMAERGSLGHEGSDGSSPATGSRARATRGRRPARTWRPGSAMPKPSSRRGSIVPAIARR